jgi:hypothetical protein
MPVEITLDHSGAAEQALVTVSDGLPNGPAYSDGRTPAFELGPLHLAAGGLWHGFLYPPASRISRKPDVELEVDGRVVQKLQPTTLGIAAEDMLLVASGGRAVALKSLSGAVLRQPLGPGRPPGELQVAAVAAAGLPDREAGYAPADLLLLNEAADDLTPTQQQAIAGWTASGGSLVLTGGPTWQRLRAPFFTSLIPARLTGSVILRPTEWLSAFAANARPETVSLIAAMSAPRLGARVLARDAGGTPLIVEWRFGLGRVYFVAFDPLDLRDWSGMPAFWTRLALSVPRGGVYLDNVLAGEDKSTEYGGAPAPRGGWPDYRVQMNQSVLAVAQADPPGIWLVAAFLTFYVLLLAPINYLVLRRLRRRELAWITTPGVILAFALLAYGAGLRVHGSRLLFVRTAIVEGAAGSDRAPAVTYAGVFAPCRGEYEVAAPDPNWRLLPLQPFGTSATVSGGDADRIEGLRLDTWEMGVVRARGTVPMGRGITARPIPGGGFELRNGSPYSLENCSVIVGSTAVLMRPLPSGSAVSVGWRWSALRPATFASNSLLPEQLGKVVEGSPQECRLKQAVLDGFIRPDVGYYVRGNPAPASWSHPVVFTGWTRQPVTELLLDGKPIRGLTATLFLIHLP